jgi:hypothetical protein
MLTMCTTLTDIQSQEFGLEDDAVQQQQQQQQQHTVASTAAQIPPLVGGLATSLGANTNVSTNRLSIYSSRTLSQQSLALSHPSQASLLASPRQSLVLPAAPTTTRHHSSRRLKRAAYCHRSGQVFVRQAPQGFVLMANRHSPSPGTRKCAQELLTALRLEIAAVEAVHAVMQDAVHQVELLAE